VAYQHHPSFRDAGLTRVAVLTTALSVAGVAATAGIWVAIAAAAPNPKTASADYAGGKSTTKSGSGQIVPANDNPESSSGDEQTTSGGS
jgi:uncharacterized protein (DUF2147 family)